MRDWTMQDRKIQDFEYEYTGSDFSLSKLAKMNGHTHVSVDFSLLLDSPMFWAP